jgi:hypothetical protein
MHFLKPESLVMPGYTENFDSLLQVVILCLQRRNGLSLFYGVDPADLDRMSHHHEAVAYNLRFASNDGCPIMLLLWESFGGGAVSCHQDIPTGESTGSNDLARPASSDLVDSLNNSVA